MPAPSSRTGSAPLPTPTVGKKNASRGPNVSQQYLHVILRGHSTVGPMLAVESILQVNLGLPNQIIGSNQIMVEYCHSEF